MRVLMLGKGWFPDELGGLDRYFRGEYEALLRSDGVAVEGVVIGPAEAPSAGLTAVSAHDAPLWRRAGAFTRAAARRRPDVVDAHFALYALAPLLASRLRGTPLVVHFHGPWAAESIAAGDAARLRATLRRALERAVYGRADRLIVLSHAFKQILVERYGISPWDVDVIPPGVDLEAFTLGDRAAARRRFDVPEDAYVLSCVRRLVPRMGVQVLIDAVQRLGDGAPHVLVAGDGPFRSELEARAADAGVAGRVRFLGRVEDDAVQDLYRAADVNVVPSLAHEGFGLIVLEAAASGTPSLVTEVGGLPETAARVDPRLVVPPDDAGALADALGALATGRQRAPDRARMREIAERHTWDANATATLETFRRATGAATGRGRMRVVYVDHVARLSGGELALLRLIPHLHEVEAHVILGEDGPLASRLRAAGVSVEVLPLAETGRELRKGDVRVAGGAGRAALSTALYTLRLARRLRRLRPDLVHTNSLKSGVYGSAAARLAGVPVLWHVRDRIADDYLSPLGVRLIRFLTRRLPSAIVANSRSTLSTLDRPSEPHVVHSVVSEVVEPPDRVRRPTVGGNVPLRVGIVGRLAPWKGQHVFLESFARAFPANGAEAVIVGSELFDEGGYERQLREQVARLGLGDRVVWRGFQEDVWQELLELDVLVHASVTPEPFGQVVVEGMAASLPVITSTAGGPAEFVEHDRTGLQVPPGDVDALADALRTLADDPALRERLGDAARRSATAFAPERIAADMTAVYRSVVDGASG